jgi:phenylalanyl-tRNA synthetase beta chain
MKFPESWLRAWINPAVSGSELLDGLTAAGLEVEAAAGAAPPFAGVVVAEIVSAEPHPNADKLRVCQVNTGSSIVQIVCGAPNARAGLKAPLAQVGAELPGGLAIKQAKLRGVESFGMLCSGRELGLGDEHAGLLELSANAEVGRDIRAELGLDDTVIELKITPNRADCLSILGLAYEVAAEHSLPPPALNIEAVAASHDTKKAVQLMAPSACPRYLSRVVQGIDNQRATPAFMRQRLERSGVRSINLVVDITNYVMLELGQPMHGFDANALQGDLLVRMANDGERMQLLDGREVTLDAKTLVIADQQQALAVAGVMGGASSKVTTDSTSIVFEAAHFAPAAIMGRARQYNAHSDSSFRFERGVDPSLPQQAIEYATQLLLQHGGGAAGPVVTAEATQHLATPATVTLRRARLASVLGMHVADAVVVARLRALGMQVTETAEGFAVTAPLRRFDIEREEDLIEEVARLVGYDQVPAALPSGVLSPNIHKDSQRSENAALATLIGRGYHEALTFAFVDRALLDQFGMQRSLALANPIASDLSEMRPSLLPGLVKALQYNLNRQHSRVRLVEYGKRFLAGDSGLLEQNVFAGVAFGPADPVHWADKPRAVDFYDVKGDVQALCGDQNLQFVVLKAEQYSYLHPGMAAEIQRDGVTVGVVGVLHPRLSGALDLTTAPVVFELAADVVQQRLEPNVLALSKFPLVQRDLAFVLPSGVQLAELLAVAKAAAGGELRDLYCFDEFKGGSLEKGQRSVAISLILQGEKRTLGDSDVDQISHAVTIAIEQQCGAKLRA